GIDLQRSLQRNRLERIIRRVPDGFLRKTFAPLQAVDIPITKDFGLMCRKAARLDVEYSGSVYFKADPEVVGAFPYRDTGDALMRMVLHGQASRLRLGSMKRPAHDTAGSRLCGRGSDVDEDDYRNARKLQHPQVIVHGHVRSAKKAGAHGNVAG